MNKAERIADLNSRVVKVINTFPVSTLNGGDKEYSFNTRISTEQGFREENYSIVVIDEGLITEVADYNGKAPPVLTSREGMLKQRLEYLKTLGAFTMLDMSQLGVQFAKFRLDTAIKYAADLDGEWVIVEGE